MVFKKHNHYYLFWFPWVKNLGPVHLGRSGSHEVCHRFWPSQQSSGDLIHSPGGSLTVMATWYPLLAGGWGRPLFPSTVWRSHTMCHNAWQLVSPRASRSTIWVSGPQLGGVLPPHPRDFQQCLETFVILTTGHELLLASNRWRPGSLLSLLRCTEQPPGTKDSLVRNVNSTAAENRWLQVEAAMCFLT